MGEKLLQPLSDAMKKMLESLGESPEEFQQELAKEKILRPRKGAMSTKKPIAELNGEYYKAVSRGELIKSVALRIQESAKLRVYTVLGYMMFQRNQRCKACGGKECCMDCSSLYEVSTDKPGSSTRVYKPIPFIPAESKLPHWIKEVDVLVEACLACWTATQEPAVEQLGYPEGALCELTPSSGEPGEVQCQQ